MEHGDDWALRWRGAVRRWTEAVESTGHRAGATWLAKRLDQPVERMQSYLTGRVRPRPEFVRAMAETAGIAPAELFALLDWLPRGAGAPAEAPVTPADLDLFARAVDRVERLAPLLHAARHQRLAPTLGADAVLAHPAGARRYRAVLSRVVSGGRYQLVTHAVALFDPVPGCDALPYQRSAELARASGTDWRPAARDVEQDPAYWSRALELRALIGSALRGLGEFSWQGQPGTRGWEGSAPAWPAHLLTQDPYSGVSAPLGADPAITDGLPLVVVGSRSYAGTLARLLAEVLDWQFVLVRGDLDADGRGTPTALRRGAADGGIPAWSSAVEHMHRAWRSGGGWPAVLLVRPYVFASATALDLLAGVRARVVYPRPPDAYLGWWEQRQARLLTPGSPGRAFRTAPTRRALERVEGVLAARPGRPDLRLALPDPPEPLPHQGPRHPEHVVDWQFRAAWTALRWLNQVANRGPRPSLMRSMRPGLLASCADALSADPDREVPCLGDR